MLKTKAFLFAPKHGDESKDKLIHILNTFVRLN